jgi:hypothetical protein
MAYLRHYADTTSKGKGWLDPVTLRTKEKPYQHDPRRLTSGGSVLTSEQLMELGMGNVGTAVLRLPGVQLINGYLRFYGPDQFSGATANSEPMVLLDGNLSGKDGKAVFTFFTSDVAGTFQVLITGITAGGDLIYKTLSFTNR